MPKQILKDCEEADFESVELLYGEEEIQEKVEENDMSEENFGIGKNSGRGFRGDGCRIFADNDLSMGVFENDS